MRTLLAIFVLATGSAAQSTIQFEDTPYSLNVGASASIGAYLQTSNGLRRTDTLLYSTTNPDLVSISAEGALTGLFPGEATITVSDSQSDLTASWRLFVTPARITLSPSTADLTVGEIVNFAAQAFDAQGRVIPGLGFTYSTSLGSAARLDGNRLTALAAGQLLVTAQLNGMLRTGGAFATALVRIVPKPFFQTRPLLSTATTPSASPVSYSKVVSANNRTAVIAGFDNGGQAAILIEAGQPKVLIAAGQPIGEAGSIILKLNSISINRQGDVAVLADLTSVWCATSILIFPRQGPMVEVPTGCNGDISPKGLANDGSMIYYRDSDAVAISRRSPNGETTDLMVRNSTVPGLGAIRDFDKPIAGGNGTVLVQVRPVNGNPFYAAWDGTKWARVIAPGDTVLGLTFNTVDWFVGNGAGVWYYRAFGNGFCIVGTVDATGKKTIVLKQNDPPEANVRMGWAHRVLDADGTDFALMAGLNTGDKYNDGFAFFKPATGLTALAISTWEGVRDAAVSSGIVTAPVLGDTSLRLQRFATTAETLLSSTAKFPVPAAVPWRFLAIGNRDAWMPGLTPSFLRPSDTRPAMLPGQKLLPDLPFVAGALAAVHPNGWTLLSAVTQTSLSILLNGNGRTTQLVDNQTKARDIQSRQIQYLETEGATGRMSVNSKGDAAYPAFIDGNWNFMIQKQGELLPRAIFSYTTLLPGGGNPGWVSRVDLDDAGDLRFLAYPNNGGAGIYQATGGTLRPLLTTREPFQGTTITSINSYCVRNGVGLATVEVPGSPNAFAISSGSTFEPVDFSAPDRGGVLVNGIASNFCDTTPTGDTFFVGLTPEGRIGVFQYQPSTRKLRAVFYPGQKLGDGATLVQPYQISAGPNGNFYFAAHVYAKDQNYLAVYEATPQP